MPICFLREFETSIFLWQEFARIPGMIFSFPLGGPEESYSDDFYPVYFCIEIQAERLYTTAPLVYLSFFELFLFAGISIV